MEYLKDGALVRTSNQFKIEHTSIVESSNRFTLAYSSLLLQSPLLNSIGLFIEKEAGQQIFKHSSARCTRDGNLSILLLLFCRENINNINPLLDVAT